LAENIVSKMTYDVMSGTLNITMNYITCK